jgi:hypothetical protein
MWVISRPIELSAGKRINLLNTTNLEPSPDYMSRMFMADEPPSGINMLDGSKRSEKKKDIAYGHLLIAQMPLWTIGLPKNRPPVPLPHQRVRP